MSDKQVKFLFSHFRQKIHNKIEVKAICLKDLLHKTGVKTVHKSILVMLNFTCMKIFFWLFFHFQFFVNLVFKIIDCALSEATNELMIVKYWTCCFVNTKNYNLFKILYKNCFKCNFSA